ncbi:MAG: GAF domain-containing protein [Myxococcota bacterium]
MSEATETGRPVRVAAPGHELREALERERRKVRALQEVGGLLGSTLDLSELLSSVLERVSEVSEAERSTLYLVDDATGELVSKVAQGSPGSGEIRLKKGEGLAGTVAVTGRPLNIKDVYLDARFDPSWDRKSGFRTTSTLCVPMRNQHHRTIGVLQVLNKRAGYFTTDDEALLTALAAQAAVSIENTKLFHGIVGKNAELIETQEKLRDRVRELDVLFEVARAAASLADLEELLGHVLARALPAVAARAAAVVLADEVTGELRCVAALGAGAQDRRGRPADALSEWVARHQESELLSGVDERLPEGVENVLCVPLRWEDDDGQGVGALELSEKVGPPGRFTEDDLRLAEAIAGQLATSIQLARTRARRDREARLTSLGQALSSVLHDLKTPMTVISGYARLLATEEDEEAKAELLATILRQVATLNMMTRETLAFARGDRKLWPRKVYLYKFFEELAEQLRRSLGDRVEVELELHDRGTAVLDEAKIQRAAHNLARNAAEALEGVGRRGTFTVSVDRTAEGTLELRFRDDGPGIPKELQPRIFESFLSHGKEEGTGLGLAIVRQVVTDHEGELTLRSEPGETEFVIRLPQEPS